MARVTRYNNKAHCEFPPLQVSLSVLMMVVIICTPLWSMVSWFVQFKRMFTVCFFLSVVWNWFYLYKVTGPRLSIASHTEYSLAERWELLPTKRHHGSCR